MTSAYRPLTAFLRLRRRTDVCVTFREIEEILGRSLPPSARSRRSYWANDLTHSQARAWLTTGREACGVSLEDERVTFRSSEAGRTNQEILCTRALFKYTGGRSALPLSQIRDHYRERDRAKHDSPRYDRAAMRSMQVALFDIGVGFTSRVYPSSKRGTRTFPGYGEIQTTDDIPGSPDLTMRFANRSIQVEASIDPTLTALSLWPRDRVFDALLFCAMWDTAEPALVSNAAQDDAQTTWLQVSGVVRLKDPRDVGQCRRLYRWLEHEANAYEDSLRKMKCRKSRLTGTKAFDLARSRLSRHVRPSAATVEILLRAMHPGPLDLIGVAMSLSDQPAVSSNKAPFLADTSSTLETLEVSSYAC